MDTAVRTSKTVGEYRVVVDGNDVWVELAGGTVAQREFKDGRQAYKNYNTLTSRDKVERFVRDNG